MRKLLALGLGLALAASLTVSAFAGPSHAIVQELGAVVPAGEVNADFNVIPVNLTAQAGAAAFLGSNVANGTIGGTTLTSVNVGLGNGFEVRTGSLPGLSSKLTGVSTANGVTVKYAGFVPGLALFAGYGSTNSTPIIAGAATTTSQLRFGGAYTAPVAGWLLNANVELGTNTPNAGASTSTTDLAVAALYPLNANVLVGGEYLNTSLATGGSTTSASGFGLGGRVIYGNFTVDAILLASISTSVTGVAQGGSLTSIGSPAYLNINYKF